MSLPCEDFFDSREDFVVLVVVVVVIVLVVVVVEANFAVVDFLFSPKERNEITK